MSVTTTATATTKHQLIYANKEYKKIESQKIKEKRGNRNVVVVVVVVDLELPL